MDYPVRRAFRDALIGLSDYRLPQDNLQPATGRWLTGLSRTTYLAYNANNSNLFQKPVSRMAGTNHCKQDFNR
jgi:hypothetical protein